MRSRLLVAGAFMACLLGVAAPLSCIAATTTGNVNISGTAIPPPASCTIASIPANLSYQLPADGVASYIEPASLTVNCTSGAPYTITTQVDYNPFTIGGRPASVRVRSSTGVPVFTTPLARTGTGANQQISVQLFVTGANGAPLTTSDYGAVSGSFQLIVTY